MSYGPYGTFYTIHLERLGFSRAFAGTAWALAAASELVVMLLWPRMCGWATPRTWLVVALTAHPLRWLLSSVAHGPVFLLAIQLTHAFTFGVLYLAAVQSVEGLAPDGLRTTAQGVFASVTFGVGGLVGNSLGGLLYEPMGMTALYIAAAVVSAWGLFLFVVGTPRERAGAQPLAPTRGARRSVGEKRIQAALAPLCGQSLQLHRPADPVCRLPGHQGRPAPVGHAARPAGLGLHVGVPVGGAGLRPAGGSPVASPADGPGRGDLERGNGALGNGPELRRSSCLGRALVGVGEASYGAVAPAMLSDAYEPAHRGRALAMFSMAIPVGSALGYLLGGVFERELGWRAAFFIVGIPGLWLAWTVGRLRDPARGGADPWRRDRGSGRPRPGWRITWSFSRRKSYLLNCLAMTAMTFAVGGLAAWVPTYLVRIRGMGLAEANLIFGLLTLVSGLGGTMAGGWLGDRLLPRLPTAYFLVSGIGLALSVPCAAAVILLDDRTWVLAAIFLAEVFIFLNTGPLNAIIANVSRSRGARHRLCREYLRHPRAGRRHLARPRGCGLGPGRPGRGLLDRPRRPGPRGALLLLGNAVFRRRTPHGSESSRDAQRPKLNR